MFGRRVSPLAFWIGYLDVVLLVGISMGMIVGTNLDTGLGRALAVPVVIVVLLMVAGFWANIARWMSWGLLISTAIWVTVAAAILPETWDMSISGWMAVGLAGLTSWAWWIEVGDYPEGG